MSENETVTAVQEETKSLDKKEIEDEEREKMLNAENKSMEVVVSPPQADSDLTEIIKPAENVTEEGREVKPKFIPIGGIKMPGFFTRSKSKEKCKDGDDGAQGELLEKPATEEAPPPKEGVEEKVGGEQTLRSRLAAIKIPNPFAKKPKPEPNPDDAVKDTEQTITETGEQKKGLLNAIRLPLANMTRRLRGQGSNPGDAEAGLDTNKTAELASMETLDDNKDFEKTEKETEDGMENVKLDIETDVNDGAEKEKLTWRERIRQQKFIIDDLAIAGGIIVFIILVIIIVAITAGGGGPKSSPIKDGRFIDAVTSCGLVEGVLEDSAFAFRGIPYAVPPIGENRWRSAQPLDKIESCWNGTFQAHNSTPVCRQLYGNGTIDGSEDCLTLDIITPHVRYDNPLPVVVLIGTETLMGGSPGKLRPSTVYARSRDVLFVRPNFRLGALGFLSLESLSAEAYPFVSGNYALSDILTALKWVQLNIKNFGGDSKSVILVGHKAGATLVTALSAHKNAKKLFARAWVSSGSASYPGKSYEEYQKINEKYSETIKCTDLPCLRNADVDVVINSVPDTWRSDSPDLPSKTEEIGNKHEWLIIDNNILKIGLNESLTSNTIPLVIGTTAHESASEKLLLRHTTWTPELVTQYIKDSKIGQLGLTDEVFNRYNATYQGLASMISDIRTICPLLSLARSRPSTPFYVVTQPHGEDNIADVDSDITAILGRYEPKTPEQRRYVTAMQSLFYNFVWKGEVSQPDKHNAVILVGQDPLGSREYPNCEFWIEKGLVPQYARQD